MAQTRNMTHLYMDAKQGTSMVAKKYGYWWIFYMNRISDKRANIICSKLADDGELLARMEREIEFNWCPKGIDIPASTLYTKIKVMAETTIEVMMD